VDFEMDAGVVTPRLVRYFRIGRAIQHALILEDRTDIHPGLMLGSVQRCPRHLGGWGEVAKTTESSLTPSLPVIRRWRRPGRPLVGLVRREVTVVVDHMAAERVVAKHVKAVLVELQRKHGRRRLALRLVGLGGHGGLASCG